MIYLFKMCALVEDLDSMPLNVPTKVSCWTFAMCFSVKAKNIHTNAKFPIKNKV